MKQLIHLCLALSFIFFSGTTTSTAQIGFSLSYLSPKATDWDELELGDPGARLFTSGYEVSMDYWFRLKKVRVEFFPEISYRHLQQSHDMSEPASTFSADFFSVGINMNIYPFDFHGDCDCPTFSKAAPGFEKGFFMQFGPGYGLNKYNNEDPLTENEDEQETLFFLGGGVGFDAGLSDFITISPMIRFAYYPDAKWDDLAFYIQPVEEDVVIDSPVMVWRFGLRLGVRFD